MALDDQFWRAVADYNLKFPTLVSLGTNAATWLEEYNRVRKTAFSAIIITSSSMEGGGGSGQKNFPQETLIDALHYVRHQLDNTYALPVHLARGGRSGFSIRLGP